MALLESEKQLSIKRKCELLRLNRSGIYYNTKDVLHEEVELMNEIREIYIRYPFLGYRKIRVMLSKQGHTINRKRVQRLMMLMGLKAVCPQKKTSIRDKKHAVYPYLLRDLAITHADQVWQVDITYIKIRGGFVYLVCLIDVCSRKIMGWFLSPFLDTAACHNAFEDALKYGNPEIVNSDQGCQFTSDSWCAMLVQRGIAISMDGVGRWADNIYVERLWRTIKYELVNLHRFETVSEVRIALANYIHFYNKERPHQALGYNVPDDVYKESKHVKGKNVVRESIPAVLGCLKDSQILCEKLS